MATRLCKFFILSIFVLIAFTAMTACGLPSRPTEVHYPYCLWASDLGQPYAIYPKSLVIVDDLTPTFSWHYPGDCLPRNYHIEVSNQSYEGDCFGGGWRGEGMLVISETVGASTEWTPAAPLEPLTLYHWHVAGEISDDVLGDYSTVACFFTGPTCGLASLVPPELVYPEDGWIIPSDYIALLWSYSGECMPESFLAELSDDPSFAGPNLMEGYSDREVPLTNTVTPFLEDCTQYYWRVTARVGSILGPTSEVWSFTTDFEGTCSDTSKSGACDFDCDCESEQGENAHNCPKDCPKHCGNGACDCGETYATCKKDCELDCECGDGVCQPQCGETPNTCLSDC